VRSKPRKPRASSVRNASKWLRSLRLEFVSGTAVACTRRDDELVHGHYVDLPEMLALYATKVRRRTKG
jgi:hypothetical protein